MWVGGRSQRQMERTHKIVCVLFAALCKLQEPELSIQLDANLYIHLRKVAAARASCPRETRRASAPVAATFLAI